MPLQQGDPPWLGRYQLTARLGAGGMGVVYLGQPEGKPPVAVKALRPEYAGDVEFRARFRREVQAMVRVQNRYTVRVLDADTDGQPPFLVTEYAEGPSLDEWVKTHGPIPPDAVIRLASALAEALAAIHAAGVTHRDLKPSNVLLTDSGPMVIDFGIAQTADSVSITRTGMAVGSPGYMAPEQIVGNAGQEADIFAWALIVAFASSGQPPFGVGQPPAIMHRVLNSNPDISAVPPRLRPLIQAAISKDPTRRPTAVDMVRDLAPGALGGIAPRTTVDPGLAPGTSAEGRTVRDNSYGSGAYGNGYPNSGDTYPGSGNTYPGQTRTLASGSSGSYPGGAGGMVGPDEPWDKPRRSRGPLIAAAAAVIVVALAVGGWFMLKPTSGTPAGPASVKTSAPAGPVATKAPTPSTGPTTPTQAPTTAPATVSQSPTSAPTTSEPTTSPTGTSAPTSTATSTGGATSGTSTATAGTGSNVGGVNVGGAGS
ncbi:MAG: serine/threonine protein kinase [Nocardiopsaceae bacterium]|nr:serine/threonine protein kinase [Nocardiopsaceae bacterium]